MRAYRLVCLTIIIFAMFCSSLHAGQDQNYTLSSSNLSKNDGSDTRVIIGALPVGISESGNTSSEGLVQNPGTVEIPYVHTKTTSENLSVQTNEYTNTSSCSVCESQTSYPKMYLDEEKVKKINEKEKKSKKLPNATEIVVQGSYSVLPYLPSIPSQRNQGYCGNCWVWAATGALEIELSVKNGVNSPLSVQYFNSKYNNGQGSEWACCGGWLDDFAEWYSTDRAPIPLSNPNAGYADYSSVCSNYASSRPISAITTDPHYEIGTISSATIPTRGVGSTTAINNIKAQLQDDKGIWYAYFLGNNGWNAFESFWDSQDESTVFNPDPYAGENLLGGHGVLIVGYDDTDPDNAYWICLNSWGTTSKRPNGLFRLKMNMNYDAYVMTGGTQYPSQYFKTLDADFLKEFIVDSEIVSNTIPDTMTGGQVYAVSVTIWNTGTMTWSEADGIRLGAVGESSGDAAKFGPEQIALPTGITVAPGESYTFAFSMTAPAEVGTYTPEFRMVWDGHQWFGQTLSRTVTVSGDPSPASVTNLQNTTYQQTYIIWTWTDPTDADFDHVMIELEGSIICPFGPLRDNVTSGVQQYNATDLIPNTSYTLSTRTVDTLGNVNTTRVNHTAQTAPDSAPLQVNAEAVSNTIPGTMTAGQAYSVSVTMRNTGTMTWSEADSIRLGGVGDSGGDASKFGPDRISLPVGTTVAPGESYTFSFTMTAPMEGDTYDPEYRMVWDGTQWFGQTLSTAVEVSVPVTVGSEVVSDTIPGTMTGGQAYFVSVTMRNTGTMAWSEADSIRLGGVGNSGGDAAKFGPDRIKIPTGTTVAPGQEYTFSYTMTAPTTGGTYTPQYRMVWDGHQWFGQTLSTAVEVSVPLTVGAEVVSNTIPGTMTGGQAYSVSVTMRNTGTMAWSEADSIRLGGVGNSGGDAAKFGPDRIKIPTGTTVAPGQEYTFSYTMTAPTTGGTYTPQYRMVWDGHQWFGQTLSTAVEVSVPVSVDAEVVSNTIPGTMTGGQAYSVSVTMRNTGTMTWSEADEIRLGGVGDSSGDAAKFGPDRIKIPTGTTVAPGQTYTFSFTMTAPTTGGTYTPQYQMVWDGHQWFGQTLSRTVIVSGGGTVNAEVVSNTIPGTMTGGQAYSVSVTMKNTGTMTWSEVDGIRLGGVGDSSGDAAKFGPDRIKIPAGTTVAPGQTYTFSFTMTAPTAYGTYTPQYRMVWDGHQWFGQTLSKTVVVPGTGTVNAEVVSNTIPGTMTRMQSYSVSVTMRNTGTRIWSEADAIRLGGVGDSNGDAAKFGPDRIRIPAGKSVSPGQTYTFSFTMTAPSTAGTYNPKYQMVWDGHQWFGQMLSKTVSVT